MLGAVHPDLLDIQVCNHYKFRVDKEAGREIVLTYRGDKELEGSEVEICSRKGNENTVLSGVESQSAAVLLPPQVGVKGNDTIVVNLKLGGETISREVVVPAMRHWTVYILSLIHI